MSFRRGLNNTVLAFPLASTEEEDSWGRYLWMRFLFRGDGDRILSKGNRHLLKIEMRPYIKNHDLRVREVIAQDQVIPNIVRPMAPPEDIAIQKIRLGSGWALSNDNYNIQKLEALNQKIAERQFRDIKSIVIIKEGQLLLEEYFIHPKKDTMAIYFGMMFIT